MARLVFDVSGVADEACARRVQEAISAQDPDAVVVVMRVAGRMSVDTVLSAEEVAGLVGAAGFPAALAFAA